MPLTVAAFRARTRKTFAQQTDEEIGSALADALAELGPTWGELADKGQELIASASLARSPAGLQAKLVRDDGRTIFDAELERLRVIVGGSTGLR